MNHRKFGAHNGRRSARGFTLVELLVVIAIIGILASLILGGLMIAKTSANKTRTKAYITNIGLAIDGYENDYHDYPRGGKEDDAFAAGNASMYKDLLKEDKSGPYVKAKDLNIGGDPEFKLLLDAWNMPLGYMHHKAYDRTPPNKKTYRLWSMGPDKVNDPLTKSSDDIVNWNKNEESPE